MSDEIGQGSGSSDTHNTASPSVPKVYLLNSGDHPGFSLTSIPLTGTNYMSWKYEIIISLLAKGKLGFITGKLPSPPEDSPDFEAWIENDAMLRAWIRNSLSSELQEAFVYIASTKDLWDNLEEKFGQCNGVFINQLKRSLSNLKQGDMSVTSYYTKLQRLVDELTAAEPPIICIYPARNLITERKERDNLIMFLNGEHIDEGIGDVQKVTNWRDLDKFVASQLSHGGGVDIEADFNNKYDESNLELLLLQSEGGKEAERPIKEVSGYDFSDIGIYIFNT